MPATSSPPRCSPSERSCFDRYTDSRYVRLAELLTMQGRVAAAIAVLEDAAAVAREVGEGATGAVTRREDLLRRAASGT